MRGIAIKALKIFQGYAKKKQTFDMVASEFNNKIDIVEKRAVLVALCKLGIPVVRPVDDSFHIYSILLLPVIAIFWHFAKTIGIW